jgi:hypothetical protein
MGMNTAVAWQLEIEWIKMHILLNSKSLFFFFSVTLLYIHYLWARLLNSTCEQVCVLGVLYYTKCSITIFLNEWKLEKAVSVF